MRLRWIPPQPRLLLLPRLTDDALLPAICDDLDLAFFSFLSLTLEHLPCRDAAYDAPALRNVQADVYS